LFELQLNANFTNNVYLFQTLRPVSQNGGTDRTGIIVHRPLDLLQIQTVIHIHPLLVVILSPEICNAVNKSDFTFNKLEKWSGNDYINTELL